MLLYITKHTSVNYFNFINYIPDFVGIDWDH